MAQLLGVASLASAFMLAALLAGCDKITQEDVTCGSSSATDVTVSLIKDQIEKDATAKSRQTDGSYNVPISNIRAAINTLKISIDDVRTTKADPNSTKRFCSASAKVVFPVSSITDAERARTLAQASSLSDITDAAKMQRNADYFTFDIDYDVQPTDDRKTIFSESDSIDPQMNALAEIVNASLLRASLESQASAQQQQQQAESDAQKAAAQQAAEATLEQAKADNALSIQMINATWTSIPTDMRSQILDAQRAWLKAKIAQCNIDAASASIDPMEKETARLKCDTTANQNRTTWLKQYVPQM